MFHPGSPPGNLPGILPGSPLLLAHLFQNQFIFQVLFSDYLRRIVIPYAANLNGHMFHMRSLKRTLPCGFSFLEEGSRSGKGTITLPERKASFGKWKIRNFRKDWTALMEKEM